MEQLSQYILSIIAAALIASVAVTLTQHNNTVSSVIKLLSGLFLAITVIAPVKKWDIPDLTGYLDSVSVDGTNMITQGKNIAKAEQESIIKQRLESYILDKATALGITPSVSVELSATEPYVPYAVIIDGAASPYARSVLQSFIEEELGISKEQQAWK